MHELSYVRGADVPDLLEMTIGQAADLAAKRWPEQLALVSVEQGVRLSFAELRQRADAVALGLMALGLLAGDRVAIWAPNCVEWTLTQIATAKAGIILVNINPAYRVSELAYTLKKVGAKLLITVPSLKSSDYLAMTEDAVPDLFAGSAAGSQTTLRHAVKIGGPTRSGWIEFETIEASGEALPACHLDAVSATLTPADPINIQFTSGTTGAPKGATLSHRNIINNGYFVGEAIRLEPGERLCIPVPLYHCFGMVMGNLACLTHGAAMIYPSSIFDPHAVLRAVEEERCSGLYGVPTMFLAVLNQPEFARFDLTSLRTGIMAGAPCPTETMREVMGRMHMSEITIAYGMTETSPVSFQSNPDDPVNLRVETVGQIMPHLESKLVDASGETVPLGAPGELCTRGYSVMLGYWEDPAATTAAIDSQGWMHTGDLATFDADGYCRIVGRVKDMIIRGGENIYPREIEEFLYTHPGIRDVAVVGVPDERFGEEVCAWVVAREGATLFVEDIREFCKGQIAHYKIPHYVRIVDSFPLTATGKVQKFAIRAAMFAELRTVNE